MVTAYEASPKVVPGRHYSEAVSVGTGLQPVWCGVSPIPQASSASMPTVTQMLASSQDKPLVKQMLPSRQDAPSRYR